MENLCKKLLELLNDGKISDNDCGEIIIALIKDEIAKDTTNIGLNKPIEPASQDTVDELRNRYLELVTKPIEARVTLPSTCKHSTFFKATFSNLANEREYWIFTEVFCYLHGGKDFCNCQVHPNGSGGRTTL